MDCHSVAAQHFVDVTKKAGIEHRFVPYQGTFGGGAVVFDINNDGFEDVYLAGGMENDRMYLNLGNGSFRDVFNESGLKSTEGFVTQGGVAADVNRDGLKDLFITTINTRNKHQQVPRATNLLFINCGNGKFRDATKEWKLDKYQTFSTGAAFGDINCDGYPDLFVANYFKEYTGDMNIMNDALIVASGQSEKCQLFINKNGKYFEEVAADWGVDHKAFGFGGMFTDYDNDGDPDLIVVNDFGYKATPNLLYENKYPQEKFTEVSAEKNFRIGINGMGVTAGDYNNDGWLDYFFTNIRKNQFLVNAKQGNPFANVSETIGTYMPSANDSTGRHLMITWGCNFADFDNDCDEDLFVVGGSLNATVEPIPNIYYENTGKGFVNRTTEKGLDNYGIGRGSVTFDYDNDGDMDILVVSQQPIYNGLGSIVSSTKLYRNDAVKGNWLKVKLHGVNSEVNGIGARVTVVCDGKLMTREIDGGSSHLSQNSTIAHFGLGHKQIADSIIVTWVGGHRQFLTGIKCNQLITITEDSIKRNFDIRTLLLIVISGILLISVSYFFFKKTNR